MKKACLAVILISFCLFFSEPKKKNEIPQFYNGTTSFLLNGIEYNGVAGIVKTNSETSNYYLSFDARDTALKRTFKLSIAYVTADKKKQLLSRRIPNNDSIPQASLSIIDGSVLYSYYDLEIADSINDVFQFTDFEELTDETEGSFELSFVIDSISNLEPLAPKKIEITEGHFNALLFQSTQ